MEGLKRIPERERERENKRNQALEEPSTSERNVVDANHNKHELEESLMRSDVI